MARGDVASGDTAPSSVAGGSTYLTKLRGDELAEKVGEKESAEPTDETRLRAAAVRALDADTDASGTGMLAAAGVLVGPLCRCWPTPQTRLGSESKGVSRSIRVQSVFASKQATMVSDRAPPHNHSKTDVRIKGRSNRQQP